MFSCVLLLECHQFFNELNYKLNAYWVYHRVYLHFALLLFFFSFFFLQNFGQRSRICLILFLIARVLRQRFGAIDGNRKLAVFLFNLSSHYRIYIYCQLSFHRYRRLVWKSRREHCPGMRNARFPVFVRGSKKPRLLKVSNVYIGTVAIEELIAQCEKFDG